jgi:hypothetical protein
VHCMGDCNGAGEPLTVGQVVSYQQEAGQAVIGGATFTAIVPWAKPVEASKRYLVFVGVNKEAGTWVIGPCSPPWRNSSASNSNHLKG